jgi:hypothetical protein
MAANGNTLFAAGSDHNLWKLQVGASHNTSIAKWKRTCTAQDVVSITVHDKVLYALDRDSVIWQRDVQDTEADWEPWEQGEDGAKRMRDVVRDHKIALVSANGFLWAATVSNRLLKIDTNQTGDGWTDVRDAIGVIGLAAVPATGHIIAACEDTQLWMWDTNVEPSVSWTAVGAAPFKLNHGFVAGRSRLFAAGVKCTQ